MLISPLLLHMGIPPEVKFPYSQTFLAFLFFQFIFSLRKLTGNYRLVNGCAGVSRDMFFDGFLLINNVIISVLAVRDGTKRGSPHLCHYLLLSVNPWSGGCTEGH